MRGTSIGRVPSDSLLPVAGVEPVTLGGHAGTAFIASLGGAKGGMYVERGGTAAVVADVFDRTHAQHLMN